MVEDQTQDASEVQDHVAVIEELQAKDNLNKTEQKRLDAAMDTQRQIDEARGYEEFTWHGRTRYRLVGNPSRDFGNVFDAEQQVAADRAEQLNVASNS